MKALILSQYYPPETGACSNRISGFARHLACSGHQVTVITGFPNYPEHKLYPGYRIGWCRKDSDGPVTLWRTWLPINYPKRPVHRFMNYAGFFFSSLYTAIFRSGPQDVIVATSGPILVGFAGVLVSLWKNRPFVLDLRDAWPERVVAAGEFKNPFALKILEWIEKIMYWRASRIICVTQGLHDFLLDKAVSKEKLTVITSSANLEAFRIGVDGKSFQEFGIPEDAFVVVYAGTFGFFQDLEMILDAAQKLQSYPDIHFLLVGDGVKRTFLEDEVARRNLTNIKIGPNLSRDKLAGVLRSSKIGVNANTQIAHNLMAIPVKMLDYMACELPVVLANEGEVEEIIRKSEAGICGPQGDCERFSGAILKLHQDEALRVAMGQRGKRLIAEHFDVKILSAEFERLLQQVTHVQ